MQARYCPPGAAAPRPGRPPPHGGEAKCKLDTPHPARPLRGRADLPTRWRGEMQARYSPPGAAAPRPGRPPHTVGRRNASSIFPTRRGHSAAGPTSPHGGEAKCKLDTPHPSRPLRGRADLPTRWGGEMQARYSPPGAAAPRPGRPTPHPARPLRGRADLPTRWGGELGTGSICIRRFHELLKRDGKVRNGHAFLLGGVPLADCHRLVVQRVEVDGHAERRADLVLAAITPADVAAR